MNSDEVWRLIGRHVAGESSPTEAAELRGWASRPDNARLLDEAARVWALTEEPPGDADGDAAWRRLRARLDSPPPARRRRSALWPAAGAALLAASLAAVALLRPGAAVPEPDQYATAAAELETVRLLDGTVVRLGPASRLSVRASREVELSGIAFFAVAEDRAQPFAVAVPGGQVVVLGTRFEVRTLGDSTRVNVVEGRVAVRGERTTVEVTAGESTVIVRGGDPRPAGPAPTRVAGWMGRTLVFQTTPLRRVAAEIEALYGVPVLVSDALADRTVTALFTDEPLDGLVSTLCRAVQARCEVTDSVIRLEAQS